MCLQAEEDHVEASDQGAVPPPKQLTLERQLNKSILIGEPVQCFAFDIEYGHLLDGEKQMGVIINTCKEFNLLPLNKGYLPIRATPPSRLGINP